MLLFAIGLIVGIQIGWYSAWLKRQVLVIRARLKPEPKSAVTLGSYGRPNPTGSSSVITPKTPQEMQRQADEALKKQYYQ